MKHVYYLLLLTVLIGGPNVLQAADRPLREACSDNKRFELRIEPARPGRSGSVCRASMRGSVDERTRGRRVWERALVNDVAPSQVFIHNDGRYVVTLDEFNRGGARHALVIYGAKGELLRHFVLSDLLLKEDWQHVKVERRTLAWLTEAECSFADGDEFRITLAWGRRIAVDLKTLRVIRDSEPRTVVAEGVPVDVLVQLLGHLEGSAEDVITARLAELAELSARDAEQDAAVVAELTPEDAAGDVLNATTEATSAVEVLTEMLAGPDPSEVAVADDPDATAAGSADAALERDALQTAQSMIVAPYTDIAIPLPNLGKPVDYVDWLNDTAAGDGPDAAPLYSDASDGYVDWAGDRDLLAAALAGDPNALQSVELDDWLAANAGALEQFQTAAREGGRSWQYNSPDGSLMQITLPNLAPLRGLSRAAVIQGRALADAGDYAGAATHYLDALAAGADTGGGMTFIENLVGLSMQDSAADALLDLHADPQADIDFLDLATAVEGAYQPPRSPVEVLQGERAFLFDTVQRMWRPDPESGETSFDADYAAQTLSMVADEEWTPERATQEFADVDFEAALVAGNTYYDGVTEVFALPYQEGSQQMAELVASARGPDADPVMRAFVPNLERYHLIRTRSEAKRRAALLVSNLHAYRRTYGEYPPSLEAFSDLGFAYDPFTGGTFSYVSTGDDFSLEAAGPGEARESADDADDLRYWPRPQR